MKKVSANVLVFFRAIAELLDEPEDRLFEDLIRGSTERGLSWWTLRKLAERCEEACTDRYRLEDLAPLVLELPWFTGLLRVLRPLLPWRLVLAAGGVWATRRFAPMLDVRASRLRDGRIRVVVRVPKPYRTSTQLVELLHGLMQAAPRLLGLPEAAVERRGSPRRAEFLLSLPEQAPLNLRARAALRLLRTGASKADLEALVEQGLGSSDPGSWPAWASASPSQQEAEAERDAAQEGMEARDRFLRTMSHEIRTPMNGVLGMTALLAETALDDVQAEYCRILQQSGKHLLTLIDDVLDFSRLQGAEMPLADEAVDLPHVVAEVFAMVRPAAAKKGLGLVEQLIPGTPRCIRGDTVRIRQVLVNLVGNAVKFTEKGSVTVAIAQGYGGVGVRLEVLDTGIGMTGEATDHIFDTFSQADDSISRDFGGSGLGLSISRLLVDRMGGRIGVESSPGIGSTFWVELPLEVWNGPVWQGTIAPSGPLPVLARPAARLAANLAEGDARVPPPLAAEGSGGVRVLLVEDDEVNQMVAERLLAMADCTVTRASNGQQAVDAALAFPFDLILMDCQMPVMDGFEATRRIRQAERGYRTPIVAFTASVLEEDRRDCLRAGMDACLAKPVVRSALDEVVKLYGVERSSEVRKLPPGAGRTDAWAAL